MAKSKKVKQNNPNAVQELIHSAEKPEIPFSRMIVLFAVAFLLHTILNILINESPTVIIDEGLYTNIARSLAWEGKLAFRGQPVNYPYLLYPFLLVPVYWLNSFLGGDIYRLIQGFNTLLITSSVFPVYLFAKDFTKDSRKAFFAAVIAALMPDMLMGGYEMTECLIWPLSFWMIFFCYRFYCNNKICDGLLAALFTGLLFATKPGAVTAGTIMLLAYFIIALVRDHARLRNAVLSILTLIAAVAVVYGVFVLLFGSQDSLLGLYTKQTEEWKPQDLWVAIEAVFLLAFLFIFACGGIFGLFPIVSLTDFDLEKRRFIISFLFGVLAVIIGTAVFVVPYKWTGELGPLPLHLRYCSMFIPVMIIFTTDRNLESSKQKALIIALAAFAVLSLFPGARAGFVKGHTGTIDSMTLAAFINNRQLNGNVTGWILTALVVVGSVLLIFRISALSKTNTKKLKNENYQARKSFSGIVTVSFLFFIVFNSICAHISANVFIDPSISSDALEVNRTIIGKECLGITQRYYDDIYSYWLESRLNKPMQQVTIDQMFIQMEETGGIYSPFIPVEQAPNVNNHKTPDTDTFILGMTIAEHLELSDSVVTEKTANGNFTIVQINPSDRWVDTMMYGLDDNALYPSAPGYIHIFDDNRNINGTITLSLQAFGNGILNISGEKVKVESHVNTYEVTIPYQTVIPVNAENGTIQILSYNTRKSSE